MGILYIVSTPIGNRLDISLRALEIFKTVDILLCEDTRKTKLLLDFYKIIPLPKLISYYEPVEEAKIPQIISWLNLDKKIGLVSNAGTPLISDPGFKLVRECVRAGVKVEAIPGASAVLTALIISGLPTDKFSFLGFLPKKEAKKIKLLSEIKYTSVMYESPFRLKKTLETLNQLRPKAQVVVARELTKKFEEIFRGTVKGILAKLENRHLKGEIVIVVAEKPLAANDFDVDNN